MFVELCFSSKIGFNIIWIEIKRHNSGVVSRSLSINQIWLDHTHSAPWRHGRAVFSMTLNKNKKSTIMTWIFNSVFVVEQRHNPTVSHLFVFSLYQQCVFVVLQQFCSSNVLISLKGTFCASIILILFLIKAEPKWIREDSLDAIGPYLCYRKV